MRTGKSHLGAQRVESGERCPTPTPGKFLPDENTYVIVFLQLTFINTELKVGVDGELCLNPVIKFKQI